MPWTAENARKHKADLSDSEAETWARIANAERERCLGKKEGDEKHCDSQAIRVASAAINNARKKAIEPSTNAIHGEGGTLSVAADGEEDKHWYVCPKCGRQFSPRACGDWVELNSPCKEHTCPQCGSKMNRADEDKSLTESIAYVTGTMHRFKTAYKSGDRWRWLTVSNVAIEDKEKEVVSEKAYDDAIAYAYANNAFGELDLVHVDGTDQGTCDLMVRLGNQLIEGGEWFEDLRSMRTRQKVQKNPDYWGVSIKFKYDPEQFDGKVYKGGIRILKRSILPRHMAASYGTGIAVHGGAQMKKIDEATIAALKELDFEDDEIAALVEKNKALPPEENVAVKEDEGEQPWYEDEGMEDAKSVWEVSEVNDLPDSCFLFIEEGGEKEDGKTKPRSLRHLPYKNAKGEVDLPHLRNAISRLGQEATGKDWKGFNREAVLRKARAILAKYSDAGEDDGKSIKVPKGFWESVKMEVSKVLDAFRKEPEPVEAVADAAETAKSAEMEVESETVQAQEPEEAQKPVAVEEKQYVTPDALKAYGEELAKVIAGVVAQAVAELKLKQEKTEKWQNETEKRMAELAKPIEMRVMERLSELPPVVKTRVSHLDATAVAPNTPAVSTPQTYVHDMWTAIQKEVERVGKQPKVEV